MKKDDNKSDEKRIHWKCCIYFITRMKTCDKKGEVLKENFMPVLTWNVTKKNLGTNFATMSGIVDLQSLRELSCVENSPEIIMLLF